MFFALFCVYYSPQSSIKHLKGSDLIWYNTMMQSMAALGDNFFGFDISKKNPDFPGFVSYIIEPYKNTINTSEFILEFYNISKNPKKQLSHSLEQTDSNFDYEEFKKSLTAITTVTLPVISLFIANTLLCLIRPFIQKKLVLTEPNRCRRVTYYIFIASGFIFLGFSIILFISGLAKLQKHVKSIIECTSAVMDFIISASSDLERAATEFGIITEKTTNAIADSASQIDSYLNATIESLWDPIHHMRNIVFDENGFYDIYDNKYYPTVQEISFLLEKYEETEELSKLLNTSSLLSPSIHNLTTKINNTHKVLDDIESYQQMFSNLNVTFKMFVDKTNTSITRPMTDFAYDQQLLEELQNTITKKINCTFSVYAKIIIALFSLILIALCTVQLIYFISPSFESQCCINYILYYDFALPLLFSFIMLGFAAVFSMLSCILSFVSIHMETEGDKIISNLADCLIDRSISFPSINLTVYSNGFAEFLFSVPEQFIPHNIRILSTLVLSDPNAGIYEGMDLQKVLNFTSLGNYIANYLEEKSNSFKLPDHAKECINSTYQQISSQEILPSNFEEFLDISQTASTIRKEIKKYPNVYKEIGKQVEDYLDDIENNHYYSLSSIYSQINDTIKNEFPQIIRDRVTNFVTTVKNVIHRFSVCFEVITPHFVKMANQISTGYVLELYATFRNIILYEIPRDSSLLAIASYLGLFSIMLMELSLLFITITPTRREPIDDQSLPPITSAIAVNNDNLDIVSQNHHSNISYNDNSDDDIYLK